MSVADDKKYERETHIYYNDLEDTCEITTYDVQLKNRLTKRGDFRIEHQERDSCGKYYILTGDKNKLSITLVRQDKKVV